MQKRQYDFTKGNIWRQLVLFSGPIILANLLQTSYQVIDSLWVGNLIGASGLGAVSISSAIIFTMLAFVIGLNNAALTILSQQKGLKSEAGLKNYLNAFVVILTTMSFVFSVLGFLFSKQLLLLLSTPEDILPIAQDYLQINFVGVLFLFGYNFISTVLRAIGDSKSPLKFIFLAVVLNFILDPLFIAGLDLGVRGAAYATVFSQGIAFLYGIYFVLSKQLAPFQLPHRPKWPEVKLILHLGIPSGLQMAVISAGTAAITGVVANFGSQTVGGYGAAQRLDNIIMLPAQSLGTSVNSMAGQNISTGMWHRVRKIKTYGLAYNVLIMCTIGLLIFTFAEPLVKLFVQDETAVHFATNYLRIMAFCFPFLGVNFVLNGIMRGAGAMYPVLILNLISFWVLRYPLANWFSGILGPNGIPVGVGLSLVISCLLASGYYRYGRWRKRELFRSERNLSS